MTNSKSFCLSECSQYFENATKGESDCRQANPLVSIIVITYNHARFIRKALDSILFQKINFNVEILVGDDCSTDGTQAIITEYAERYPHLFKLWLRTENIGATRNSYELLLHAKGDFIATCEGDDFWIDKNKIKRQVDYLHNHPQYVGCTHDVEVVDEDDQISGNQTISWVKKLKTFSMDDFEGIYMPGQPSTFVRRNIYRDLDLDFSILYKAHPLISDRTAMLIFLSQGDFYRIDGKLSAYRRARCAEIKSATSQQYTNNVNWIIDDLHYTKRLEQYARTQLNRPVKFSTHKKDLLSSYIVNTIKNPRQFSLSDWNLLCKEIDGFIPFINYFFFTFLKSKISAKKV